MQNASDSKPGPAASPGEGVTRGMSKRTLEDVERDAQTVEAIFKRAKQIKENFAVFETPAPEGGAGGAGGAPTVPGTIGDFLGAIHEFVENVDMSSSDSMDKLYDTLIDIKKELAELIIESQILGLNDGTKAEIYEEMTSMDEQDQFIFEEVLEKFPDIWPQITSTHKSVSMCIDMVMMMIRAGRAMDLSDSFKGAEIKDMYSSLTYSKQGLAHDTGKDTAAELALTEYQDLLLYLYNELAYSRFRRCDDKCMEEIVYQGHRTKAWQDAMPIVEFVGEKCNRETRGKEWLQLTKRPGLIHDIVNYMVVTAESQFPDVNPDRHIFSFANGIFMGKVPGVAGKHMPVFFPYGHPDMPSRVTSSKFFQMPFDPDWICSDPGAPGPAGIPQSVFDIPTPNLDKVMTDQEMDEETRAWLYVMIGRMAFEVGEYDSWQVMLYLMGAAGTGKSTLIQDVISRMYSTDQVFMCSNNTEKKFGLQNALNEQSKLKHLVAMPEVKADFGLEQAEWQQMVSGEKVTINRKHKTSVTVQFTAPLVAAGNEMIGFTDNGGSMSRRMAIFRFPIKLGENMDGALPERLHQEMAAILAKCIQAYVAMVIRIGDDNIWKHACPSMIGEKRDLEKSGNALQSFINSDRAGVGTGLFCPCDVFSKRFAEFSKEMNFPRQRWGRDLYDAVFREHGIKVSEAVEKRTYGGSRTTAKFILGADVCVDGEYMCQQAENA